LSFIVCDVNHWFSRNLMLEVQCNLQAVLIISHTDP